MYKSTCFPSTKKVKVLTPEELQGASVSAVKRLIQGAPGTSVTLHLMRGIKSYSVTLMREAAPPSTVASEKKRKVHERVKELMDGKVPSLIH